MKKLLLIVAISALSGCSDMVTGYSIEEAINLCKDRKGVISVSEGWLDESRGSLTIPINVQCGDGVSISKTLKVTKS